MSRSIHKTVAQVVRENSKPEIEDPKSPDIAALARKRLYKKAKHSERRAAKEKDAAEQPHREG